MTSAILSTGVKVDQTGHSLTAIDDGLKDPFIQNLCRHLSPSELADKASLVCTTWNRWASDPSLWPATQEAEIDKLKELNCHIIDEEQWEKALKAKGFSLIALGLSLGDLKPMNFRSAIIKTSRFYADLEKGKTSVEGNAGITILSMPQNLDVQLLCRIFPTLILATDNCFVARIFEQIADGSKKVEKAYRTIITNHVIVGSREKALDDQRAFCRSVGCTLPEIKEIFGLSLLTESLFPRSVLFGKGPSSYVPCEMTLYPVCVGDLRAGHNGFRVGVADPSSGSSGTLACRNF